ncbi:MAG: hypothetical protein IKU48_04745 [Clostridia bacterium]|nr:hypothetical protein [Clostridia bacterium]
MKQIYSKPFISLEVFSLTQSVTRDCDNMSIPKDQLTSNDPINCKWELGGGFTVFMVSNGCTIEGENMGYACYNNPGEGQFIFRS